MSSGAILLKFYLEIKVNAYQKVSLFKKYGIYILYMYTLFLYSINTGMYVQSHNYFYMYIKLIQSLCFVMSNTGQRIGESHKGVGLRFFFFFNFNVFVSAFNIYIYFWTGLQIEEWKRRKQEQEEKWMKVEQIYFFVVT